MGGWTSKNKNEICWDGVICADAFKGDGSDIKGFVKITGDTMTGPLDIQHTSTENDDHSLEIDVNAAGFGDVKGIDIDYITGAISTGKDEECILINIDESLATGGDVAGVEVLATEGDANIFGLEVAALVNPIEQLSGVFEDMDSITVAGDDKLTELQDGGAGNVTMFASVDDTVIVGDVAKFEEIEFLLDIFASGAGIKPKFEFSTGGTGFTEFSPADGTNAFRNTGVVFWLDADIPTWAANSGEFLIKITRERTQLTTSPRCDKVQIVKGTEFKWDKNGDISIRNATLSGQIALTKVGSNIITASNANGDLRFGAGGGTNDLKIDVNGNVDIFENLTMGGAILGGGAGHDQFSDFVADEHIAHTGVTITAGAGLTGGGTIAATRTLNVIAGTGIVVNANDVQVDTGVVATFNNSLTMSNKTLTAPAINDPTLILADTTPTADGSIGFDRTNEKLQIGNGSTSEIIQMGAWNTWTPTWGGFSSVPTGGTAEFMQIGKLVIAQVSAWAAGTSNATTFTITLPIAAAAARTSTGSGAALDNSAWQVAPCRIDTRAASTTADLYFTHVPASAWTNTGGKVADFHIVYQAA